MASTAAHSHNSDSVPGVPVSAAPRRIILFSIVAVLVGGVVAVGLERVRYETLGGYYQAGISVVTAGRVARISRLLVAPGTRVKAGQPLVLLEDDQLQLQLQHKRRDVQALQAELDRTEAQFLVELEWRRKAIQTEVFDVKLKSAHFLKQQFSDQIESIAWEEAVNGLTGTASLDTATAIDLQSSLGLDEPSRDERRIRAMLRQEAAINAREVSTAQLEMCNDRVKQLEGLETQLPDKIRRTMGLDLVQAKLDDAQAELTRLENQRKQLRLVAQTPGVVGVFQKRAGEHVQPDDAIVQLLDEDQPHVILQIPSARLADFATGQKVQLRFPGGAKGAGIIERVAPQTSPVPTANGLLADSLLIARIAPEGQLWPALPVGTTVEVRRYR